MKDAEEVPGLALSPSVAQSLANFQGAFSIFHSAFLPTNQRHHGRMFRIGLGKESCCLETLGCIHATQVCPQREVLGAGKPIGVCNLAIQRE